MNRLPTVKLRNTRTGATRIVNATMYAANLGSWGDWKIIETRDGGVSDAVVRFERQQEEIERARIHNPKSPAYKDAQIAYEQRALTTATNIALPIEKEEAAKEVTSAVSVQAAPEPESVEREVPVIGGKQVVKMRGRPPKRNADNEVL